MCAACPHLPHCKAVDEGVDVGVCVCLLVGLSVCFHLHHRVKHTTGHRIATHQAVPFGPVGHTQLVWHSRVSPMPPQWGHLMWKPHSAISISLISGITDQNCLLLRCLFTENHVFNLPSYCFDSSTKQLLPLMLKARASSSIFVCVNTLPCFLREHSPTIVGTK